MAVCGNRKIQTTFEDQRDELAEARRNEKILRDKLFLKEKELQAFQLEMDELKKKIIADSITCSGKLCRRARTMKENDLLRSKLSKMKNEARANTRRLTKLETALQKAEQEKQKLADQLTTFQKHQSGKDYRTSIRKILQDMKEHVDLENSKCPICVEPVANWTGGLKVLAPCGHTMCGTCYAFWKLLHNSFCPNCRTNVDAAIKAYF